MAYKLIVAENSPSIQRAIEMAFSQSEFEIYSFKDGLEVIKSLSQINADAILLSLSLPGRNGYEVGFYLKSQEEFKKTSLILLKGAFEPLDKEKMATLDYDEVVQKPFDSEELVRTVRGLIEGKKDSQSLPEESALDEIPVPESDINPQEEDFQIEDLSQDVIDSDKNSLSSFSPEWEAKIEETVRGMIKGEILDVERELEKRIKAQVLAELKSEIQKEIRGRPEHKEQKAKS